MPEHKTFQVALWKTKGSKNTDALLREYERLDQALKEYEREKEAGTYDAGSLARWDDDTGEWVHDPKHQWGMD